MTFLSPIFGLTLLAIIPIIIIHKFIKRYKRQNIPNNELWEELLNHRKADKKIDKLRNNIPLILQILIIIIVTILLIEPRFNGKNYLGEKVAIILDTSYSMESKIDDAKKIRIAKNKIKELLKKDDSIFTLYTLDKGLELKADENLNSSELENILDDVICTKKSNSEIKTIQLIEQLALDKNLSAIYFVTDHNYDFEDEKINQIVIASQKINNIGILDIDEKEDDLYIKIKNYGNEKINFELKMNLDGSNTYKIWDLEIEEKESKYFQIKLDEEYSYLDAKLDYNDDLVLDNSYYYVKNNLNEFKVLLVTSGNEFLQKALKLDKTVDLEISDSQNIIEGYDLYVYDNVLTEKYPKNGHILEFVKKSKSMVNAPFEYKLGNHEIFKYIDNDFSIYKASKLNLPNWASPLITANEHILAYVGEENGYKRLVFGFDIFDSDIVLKKDFPILIINSLKWIFDENIQSIGRYFVGDDVNFQNRINNEDIVLRDNMGKEKDVEINNQTVTIQDLLEPGIYSIEQDDKIYYFSVNLNSNEIIKVDNEFKEQGTLIQKNNVEIDLMKKKSMRKVILIFLLLILIIEWGVYRYDY